MNEHEAVLLYVTYAEHRRWAGYGYRAWQELTASEQQAWGAVWHVAQWLAAYRQDEAKAQAADEKG